MAKDFFGNDLFVGDTVAFMQIGYRRLVIGTVKKITDKILVISHDQQNVGGTETKQYHDKVVKKIHPISEKEIVMVDTFRASMNKLERSIKEELKAAPTDDPDIHYTVCSKIANDFNLWEITGSGFETFPMWLSYLVSGYGRDMGILD